MRRNYKILSSDVYLLPPDRAYHDRGDNSQSVSNIRKMKTRENQFVSAVVKMLPGYNCPFAVQRVSRFVKCYLLLASSRTRDKAVERTN